MTTTRPQGSVLSPSCANDFSGNPDPDYFAAGMHEALIERLSQLPEIRLSPGRR